MFVVPSKSFPVPQWYLCHSLRRTGVWNNDNMPALRVGNTTCEGHTSSPEMLGFSGGLSLSAVFMGPSFAPPLCSDSFKALGLCSKARWVYRKILELESRVKQSNVGPFARGLPPVCPRKGVKNDQGVHSIIPSPKADDILTS